MLNIANFLSFLRIAITPVIVWILLFHQGYLCYGIIFFSLAAITDTCDGYVARRYGLMTEFGNFLDPFADKVLIFSTFFSFYLLNLVPLWFVLLVIMRDSMITFLRLAMVNQQRPLKTSYLGKWKTTMQIVLIYAIFVLMLLKGGNWSMMVLVQSMVSLLIYLVAFMTIYSGASYFMSIVKS